MSLDLVKIVGAIHQLFVLLSAAFSAFCCSACAIFFSRFPFFFPCSAKDSDKVQPLVERYFGCVRVCVNVC